MIRILASGALVLLAVGSTPAQVRGQHADPALRATVAATQYIAPVPEPLRVLRPFDPPATPYGPGHRGVDLAAGAAGGWVHTAAAGVVTFAGAVAGRGVVVVLHPDGIRTEYEPLRPVIAAGVHVGPGALLGRIEGRHAGCGTDRCLHWGARRGETYLDPLALLRPLGPVRLLPWPRDG